MADSNKKAKIDFTNVELVKFDIHISTSLTNNIYKTYCKLAINNFTKYSINYLITLLIMKTGAESTIQKEKSFIFCYYQVEEIDCKDIDNIDHIREDNVLLWQKIICCDGQLIEVNIDMDHD